MTANTWSAGSFELNVSAAAARVRRGRRGFSGEAQEDIVEWVRARPRAVPINIISEVKEMGKLRLTHAINKSVSSR